MSELCYFKQATGWYPVCQDKDCENCEWKLKDELKKGNEMGMTARFELVDYEDREKAYDNPRVVVTDAGPGDGDMVRICVGNERTGFTIVKVSSKEMMEAVNRCTRVHYPYL